MNGFATKVDANTASGIFKVAEGRIADSLRFGRFSATASGLHRLCKSGADKCAYGNDCYVFDICARQLRRLVQMDSFIEMEVQIREVNESLAQSLYGGVGF